MNWILDAYSDVYNAAALRDVKPLPRAEKAPKAAGRIAKLFGRG